MLPSSTFRHTRRAFSAGMRCGGLSATLMLSDEVLDFSPRLEPTYEIDHHALVISALSRQIVDAEDDLEESGIDERSCIRAVLERIDFASTRAVSAEHEELLARMRQFAQDCPEEMDEDFSPPGSDVLPYVVVLEEEIAFERPAHSKLRVHIETLPDGRRIETFSNGSMLTKDALGRVVEVRSTYGDCLFLAYGAFGHLEEFARTDSRGFMHSSGRLEKHGVTVRDAEGRVRAAGESMTIDPRGGFYLHTLDGQYFALDLVTGTHSERRRIFQANGTVDFLTAIFAHDGFRMASMYAVSGGTIRYRFYGRDGTIIEFHCDDDVRDCRPSVACAPGTKPVHKTWLKRSQGRTAWQSVFDYLSRVS